MNDRAPSDIGRFGSGQAVRRLEDPALVTGRGLFTDDARVSGLTHLVFVRSTYPHARILSIDPTAALAVAGVLAVYTGADLVKAGIKAIPSAVPFKRTGGLPMSAPPRYPLAVDFVRYVGEAVAAIVATTREAAQDAMYRVEIEYEELSFVSDSAAAVKADAPRVWQEVEDNICAAMRHGDAKATSEAFAKAAHVVALDINNQRLAPCPMEPRSVLAEYDPVSERITIRMSSQMPTGVRNTLAENILSIARDKVRVLVGDVGGGFGMKTGIYPEDAVVAFCARALVRPVKWIAQRGEEFLSAIHGRDLQSRAELALDAQGKVLALRVASLANVGAYPTAPGIAIQLMIGPWVTTSIYDIQTIDFDLKAVLTHTATTGPYRGAGRPEAIYIIERLMDAAARKMGIDGAELRRRNMIRPEQMPYKNAMGQTYDSGRFESILEQGLKLADWSGFEARWKDSAARGRLRGRGIATFLEWTGGNAFEERVTINVAADGFIEIVSATQAMGQGIATSYAQLAVDIFKVPIQRIRILQGDTDRAEGFGSAGSRSLFTGGSAITVAAERVVHEATDLAAAELEAPVTDIEYVDGAFRVAGTDHKIDLFELAGRQEGARIYVDSTSSVAGPTWPNGCHVCEVEIDPETGAVEIVSYAGVNDVGRVVNPLIVVGQLEGGAVQGIGQALSERLAYDPESGQLLTASFLDYAIPHADVFTHFKTELDQSIPCKTNPLGVKGVGELGTIGATPTVVNAIVDALARSGVGPAVYELQMPVTSERIWQALKTRSDAPTTGS
ncbi:MAG: xanthine dehydrogenase family protein molybdopterin-binding subunit [Burkholderiaceae bacterium]|jgi:carbon-monoxide dehydrogenase large subunit